MIEIINALRQQGQESEVLTASISGKGKPYWQVSEEESVAIEGRRISVRLVFEPIAES